MDWCRLFPCVLVRSVGEMPDDVGAVDEGQDEHADAGAVLHAEEGFWTKFAVAERDEPAKAGKPAADAERDASNAGEFAGPVGGNPFAGDKMGGDNNPKDKDSKIAQHANKAGHE